MDHASNPRAWCWIDDEVPRWAEPLASSCNLDVQAALHRNKKKKRATREGRRDAETFRQPLGSLCLGDVVGAASLMVECRSGEREERGDSTQTLDVSIASVLLQLLSQQRTTQSTPSASAARSCFDDTEAFATTPPRDAALLLSDSASPTTVRLLESMVFLPRAPVSAEDSAALSGASGTQRLPAALLRRVVRSGSVAAVVACEPFAAAVAHHTKHARDGKLLNWACDSDETVEMADHVLDAMGLDVAGLAASRVGPMAGTLLHAVAASGHRCMLDVVLKRCGCCYAGGKNEPPLGVGPITKAPSSSVVRSILFVTDRLGYCPLHDAASKGHTAVVQRLVNAFRVSREDFLGPAMRERSGCTPLHFAVEGDHAETVAYLLDAFAITREDVLLGKALRDEADATILHVAAARGAPRVGPLLVGRFRLRRAEVGSALDYRRNSPFDVARFTPHGLAPPWLQDLQ